MMARIFKTRRATPSGIYHRLLPDALWQPKHRQKFSSMVSSVAASDLEKFERLDGLGCGADDAANETARGLQTERDGEVHR